MTAFENALNTLLVGVYRDLEVLEEKMVHASRLNLSISEIHMLEAVQCSSTDKAATISDLSEYLGISLPSATLSIKKLAAKGFVTRQKCPHDGRVVEVSLTASGKRAERVHQYFHHNMVRSISREMTEHEKDVLLDSIVKLDQFLKRNIQKYTKKK